MSGGVHRLWKNALVDVAEPAAGREVPRRRGRHRRYRLPHRAGGSERRTARRHGLRHQPGDARRSAATAPPTAACCRASPGRRAMPRACRSPTARSTPTRSPSACATSPTSTRRSREAHRVLKPGGRFHCLEFSKVTSAPIGRVYDAYSERALPFFGRFVARDAESYRYLHESIRRFPAQRDLGRAHAQGGLRQRRLAQHDAGCRGPAFGLADLDMLRAIRNTWRLLRMALSLARHDALFPLETLGIAPALIAWARLFARRARSAPAGRAAGGGAAGDGAVLHQARPGAVDPRRSLERGGRRRSRAAAGPPAGLLRRRGAAHHRGRARPADRRAVHELRRRAGRRRLDRPGPFRRHHRRPRRRGEGAAARHREGLRARPRPLLLDGRAGRAHPAALPPAEAGRIRCAPSPTSCGSRWTCAWKPPRPRSWARTSPTIPAIARPPSTGTAPPSAC